MLVYEHTQPGTVIRWLMGLALGVSTLTMIVIPETLTTSLILSAGALLLFLVIILAQFHALTVTVYSDEIVASFGVGLIKKRIRLSDIEVAKLARNSIFVGWGIRWIKGGWCFNVSGFDTVELRLRNGRKFRIGTDEPNRLLAAIQKSLG